MAIKISNGIKTQNIKIKNDHFLAFVLLEGGPDGIKINGNSYQNEPVNINSINIDKEEKRSKEHDFLKRMMDPNQDHILPEG